MTVGTLHEDTLIPVIAEVPPSIMFRGPVATSHRDGYPKPSVAALEESKLLA